MGQIEGSREEELGSCLNKHIWHRQEARSESTSQRGYPYVLGQGAVMGVPGWVEGQEEKSHWPRLPHPGPMTSISIKTCPLPGIRDLAVVIMFINKAW